MEDLALTLLTVSGCLILLQVQAINFFVYHKLLGQGILGSVTHYRRHRKWWDQRPRWFWVRPGRTSAWWDNMMDNVTLASKWKGNFTISRPSFMELWEDLRPQVKRK